MKKMINLLYLFYVRKINSTKKTCGLVILKPCPSSVDFNSSGFKCSPVCEMKDVTPAVLYNEEGIVQGSIQGCALPLSSTIRITYTSGPES